MKKIFYILSLAAAASIALVSCVKEVAPHEPGPADAAGCYGVYFPTQDASGDHVYSPVEEKVLNVTVARTNTQGAITVPVKMTFSEDGIFEVAPVTFADGQEETSFAIRFDKAKEGVNYTGQFVIEDNQYASLYNSGAIGLDFSVMCVEMKYFLDPKTNERALVTFNQGWWGEVATGYIKYYEVDNVRTCFTETIDHLYKGALTVAPGFWGYGADYEWTFTWYIKQAHPTVEGATLIQLPWQPTGYVHDELGMVYLGDYVSEQNFWGKSYDWMTEAKAASLFTPSYYDGNGGFYFSVYAYANAEGRGWAADPFETVGVASGFTRVDYSFELATDFSDGGKAPVYIEAGADIKNIKYAVYPGELTETQVGNKIDAIAAGTEAVSEFSAFEFDAEEGKNYATLEVSPEATGKYTFVAVAYDESKQAQNSGSVVFNFIAASDEAEYAVDVDVFTEDTPARYKNFHDYDSFAYCVSGTDLVDVHVAIYTEATVAKYGSEVIFADAKADEDGDYALTEEQLAEVNADGGYYTIESGLAPNTTYYVVVWATNGSLEQFAVDAYTTAKMPYVWNSLGKGIINDGFFNYLFTNKPETKAPCDVYEEAATPGLYMITGFQCAVSAGFFGVTPEDMAPYEGGNWKNTEVVIDATNPNAVTIDAQDYGILVNSAYGFFKIRSSKPGTLKNGVITFPKEGLDCYLDGYGWIPANDEGTFSVTLPSAVTSSVPVYPFRNGVVENVTVSKTNVVERPVVKYERDAKAVSVDVKVSYDRKAIDSASTVAAKPAKSVK